MNRRLITMAIGLAVVLLILGFFFVPNIKNVRTPKVTKPESEIQKYLDQAEGCLKENELPKAKEIYAEIIEKYPDSEIIKTVQEKLEKINMDILFSPVETKDSTMYVVKEGDSLGKIAKKFNTTVELLMKSNRLTNDLIHPGKRLKVTTTTFSVIVDKSQNALTLKANDEVLKVYEVSTGMDNTTPTGKFEIVNKLMDPVWYKAGAIVPSGSPENILGSRWLGISEPGYGIHGTTEPESIGKSITAGCVRMYNKDVEELYAIIPEGVEVTIVD